MRLRPVLFEQSGGLLGASLRVWLATRTPLWEISIVLAKARAPTSSRARKPTRTEASWRFAGATKEHSSGRTQRPPNQKVRCMNEHLGWQDIRRNARLESLCESFHEAGRERFRLAEQRGAGLSDVRRMPCGRTHSSRLCRRAAHPSGSRASLPPTSTWAFRWVLRGSPVLVSGRNATRRVLTRPIQGCFQYSGKPFLVARRISRMAWRSPLESDANFGLCSLPDRTCHRRM